MFNKLQSFHKIFMHTFQFSRSKKYYFNIKLPLQQARYTKIEWTSLEHCKKVFFVEIKSSEKMSFSIIIQN